MECVLIYYVLTIYSVYKKTETTFCIQNSWNTKAYSTNFGLVLNHILFSLEQALIRIFTASNLYAMSNLVKAIDLKCRPIMQIY